MAFPTTGLSDNQVHKEGNRAFVYDSALGTWDQVKETDRAENKFLSGKLGSNVTFPAGHVLQTVIGSNLAASAGTTVVHTATPSLWPTIVSCAITPSAATSQILINFTVNLSGDGGSFALHILRGSQEVGQAAAAGGRIRSYFSGGDMKGGAGSNQYDLATYSGVMLDDISSLTAWTSGVLTYYIKLSFYGVGSYRINKTVDDRDVGAGIDGRSACHIVLQEIA